MKRYLSGILLPLVTLWGSAVAVAQVVPPAKVWTVQGQAPVASAAADIVDAAGTRIGQALFRQGPRGVLMDLSVKGLPAGPHGIHFHAGGQCDAATKFASAMHHMGLEAKPHGYLNPKGHHAGDLPNIIVASDGSAQVQFYSEDVRISGKAGKGQMLLLDTDGSSLIIHEKADDGFTQPAGGAGGRMACGVIKAQ